MNRPKISLIIPVYNVERYLEECINSITSQSMREIEIICIYDVAEEDFSVQILKKIAKRDNRIIIKEGRKRGLSGARNDGMRIATGEIIWFVDADDTIIKGACQGIYSYFLKNKLDILVMGTNFIPHNEKVPSFYIDSLYTRNKYYSLFSPKALFRETGSRPFVWRNCYRKEFLDRCLIEFDEENRVGEDQVFQLEVFPKASRIRFISERLYNYRWFREGSLQYTFDRNEYYRLNGHIEMVKHVVSVWNQYDYSDDMWYAFLIWAIDFLSEEIPFIEGNNKAELSKKAINVIETIKKQVKKPLEKKYIVNQYKLLQDLKVPIKKGKFHILRHSISIRGFKLTLMLLLNRVQFLLKAKRRKIWD